MITTTNRPKLAVIGGGVTGCGVARDLALRGCDVTLLEYGDLGSGTSSRFHGMLQSGARYAVSDTEYAAECMRERKIIARIAPQTVETTGGLFVSLANDPPDFAKHFVEGCKRSNIPCEELDPEWVRREETSLHRDLRHVFAVPDATINAWHLVTLLADDVRNRGGRVLDRHRVTGLDIKSGQVHSLQVVGGGRSYTIGADVVVNAAGPWSARVAAQVGQRVDLELTKGVIIVFAHRMVHRAINRCRPPGSHDIMVPCGTVSLFGATSEIVEDPDDTHVKPGAVQALLNGAEEIIPDIRNYRALRAWAGVRPLVKSQGQSINSTPSRSHRVIDHGEHGAKGFFSVSGGSLTTHRAMAEEVADRVCSYLGIDEPCKTADTPLSTTNSKRWQPTAAYAQSEREQLFTDVICECELVTRTEIKNLVQKTGIDDLHDLRRRLRVGFGPCQGTFCGCRLAALLSEYNPDFAVRDALNDFWVERLKGSLRTAWGEQARQTLLSDMVHRETIGMRLATDARFEEERR